MVVISWLNLTGFWHSQPDLSQGYQSCYFFWDTGEYAYMESIKQGIVYTGNWVLNGSELTLSLCDAALVDGRSVNIRLSETVVDFSPSGCKIFIDGECFFLLERDPQSAIVSLVPTWGMTASEREAFSSCD